MVLKTVVVTGIAALWLALPNAAAAQDCSAPGAAFGVTSYECEKCGLAWKQGRSHFIFSSEPRVLSVAEGSPLRAGDVVVSVDRDPITTPEGSDSFTYPIRAWHRIQVKRNGTNAVLLAQIMSDCIAPPAGGAPQQPATAETGGGDVDAGKYGFALACRPSCTQTKGPNGVYYWKFDAEPPIVAVRPGTAAAAAGLKVGDKVVEIEGKPVTSPDGGWQLFTAQAEKSLTFTVDRDGKRMTYTMRLRK